MRTKAELRAELVRRRRELPAAAVEASSRAIAERVLAAVDWPAVRRMHVYAPVVACLSVEVVVPVTYALPFASTARPLCVWT